METSTVPESYPRLRWCLAATCVRLWARWACDLTGLGPSTSGRLCCLLILGAAVFGALLVLFALLKVAPPVAPALALSACGLVLLCGSALVLVGSDADLAVQRERLLRILPEAKAAWQAQRERLRAEREKQRKAAAEAELPGPGTYEVEVVGESHYQKELEALCGGRTEESARVKTTAVLVLDDHNPYDSKAVRVEIGGCVVGHLSRVNARQYRKKLQEAGHPGIRASCKALIVGGWDRGNGDRGHFGVRLDLPTAE